MQAMILNRLAPLAENPHPLELVDLPRPVAGENQVLVEVSVCAVCHTELDEIEGRTPPPGLPIVPGHEVIGRIVDLGKNATKHNVGDRVGIGWINMSDGGAHENLSPHFCATGRDANGGYAQYMVVHEDYAFPIPAVFSDQQAAPLLCAGAIGYRALRLTGISNGQSLGLTGFGGSAHIVIQLSKHLFPDTQVYVFARDEREREFAMKLGAFWSGNTTDIAPSKLDAIIDTTPAWTPMVHAMGNLAPGGRLVINAIRKQENDKAALLNLTYEKHLWMEKEIKTVANITANDIAEFLPIAASIPINPTVQIYALKDANRALLDLKNGSVEGAKVLIVSDNCDID